MWRCAARLFCILCLMNSIALQFIILGLSAVIIPLGAYLFKRMGRRFDAQDDSLKELTEGMLVVKTVLMGVTGSNGLRSQVVENAKHINEIQGRIDRAQIKI